MEKMHFLEIVRDPVVAGVLEIYRIPSQYKAEDLAESLPWEVLVTMYYSRQTALSQGRTMSITSDCTSL